MIPTRDYTIFLKKDEIFKFECDLEKGNYEYWVNKYPDHVLSIFGAYLGFY